MTSSDLKDQLDQLLENYLTLLDSYESLQSCLQRDLKRGYLNLARSKLALGPHKVSQRGWDLTEKVSNVEILVQREEQQEGNDNETTRDTTEGTTVQSTNLNWSIQRRKPLAETSSPPETTDTRSQTLRQRNTTTRSTSAKLSDVRSTDDSSPPPLAPVPITSKIPSPLSQFSAFPPTALRSASRDFEGVLGGVVGIVEVERRLRGLGKEIKVVKKKIRDKEKMEKGTLDEGVKDASVKVVEGEEET